MSNIKAPTPPVVGGHPKNHSGQSNKPPMHVVIHSAVIPCEPGRARQLGEWNKTGQTGGSWHYSTDPEETIQCSYDSYVCWAAPPNPKKIHIEMADWPEPAKKGVKDVLRSTRWAGKNHRKMLRRTAALTGHLCLAYDIPVRMIGVKRLKAGEKGIVTHNTVSIAFRQSSHWDPGIWPRRYFMKHVRKEVARLTGVKEKDVKKATKVKDRVKKGKKPDNLLSSARSDLERIISRGTWERREERITKALKVLPDDSKAA